MGLLTDEVIQRNLGALSSTLSGIDPKHIEGASKTFGKIEQENMPQIDKLLGMVSNKMSLITNFRHKHFHQKFHQFIGYTSHDKISTAFGI